MPDRSTDRLPTIRFGVPLLVLAVLAALPLLPIPGCGGSKPAPGPSGPKPTDVVLRLDGMEFTFAEVDEWADFLRIAYPMAGRKTIVQAVLEQHVIPLRLAERAFPEERAQLLREATEASGVLTNVYELEQAQQGGNLEVQERRKYTRLQPAIPVAAHLFNRMNEGSVSKPLAVPRGFVLAATHEYTEVPVAGEDLVEATQVGFFHHTVGAWNEWHAAEKARIKDKVTYVHPDFRDALPTWCERPRPAKEQGQ